jgi:ribonuclease E
MQSSFVEIGLDSDAFLYVTDFLEEIEEFDHVVTEDKTAPPAEAPMPHQSSVPRRTHAVSHQMRLRPWPSRIAGERKRHERRRVARGDYRHDGPSSAPAAAVSATRSALLATQRAVPAQFRHAVWRAVAAARTWI